MQYQLLIDIYEAIVSDIECYRALPRVQVYQLHSLRKVVAEKKEPRPGARTRGLRYKREVSATQATDLVIILCLQLS